MENLRVLDVYFCKLCAKCRELSLYHGILKKSYSKLILDFLDSDFCPEDDKSFWERFVSDVVSFNDWFRLIQCWKFWQDGDEEYLRQAGARLDFLCSFITHKFIDLPF